jgi:hypothetical protein
MSVTYSVFLQVLACAAFPPDSFVVDDDLSALSQAAIENETEDRHSAEPGTDEV